MPSSGIGTRAGLLLLFVLSSSSLNAQTVPSVGQWERFEVAAANTKSYSDPYVDVSLNVTYTRPDGSTVAFWGFYDGGSTWKIRFMPDQLGRWQYHATFSDGRSGVSGAFDCV